MTGTTFIRELFSDSPEVSSKRVIAIFSFVLFFGVVTYSLLAEIKIDSTIIYALVSLIIGQSAMTLVQNKNDTTKND